MIMLMNNHKKQLGVHEGGFAAIVIAIVLVLVLSLLTVGFAELMRKEEKSALDKHLSNQAFYNAESGINDAAKAINAGYTLSKTSCAPLTAADIAAITDPTVKAAAAYLTSNQIDAAGNTYPCLLINPAPTSLEYGSVDDSDSVIVRINGVSSADPTQPALIKTIVINWQDADGGTGFVPSGNSFNKSSNWPATTGVMRVGVTTLASGLIDRSDLIGNTFTAFLYPNGSNSAPNSANAAHTNDASGDIVNGNCDTSRRPEYCRVDITNLGQANYLLSLRSIYRHSRVTIQAYGFDGSQLRIKNAQTVVDSTGKAQDILKRVQVRIPTHDTFSHSDSGLEVMSGICKQLQLIPTSGSRACSP
jgi:Tfp pilus assembly protein PilX